MKTTAVEWLATYLKGITSLNCDEVIEQAKAMEKEQMNHIVDTNEMVSDNVLFEQATVAMEEIYGYGCDTEIDAYFRGAKWVMSNIRHKNTH